jgi:hypothetical protein
MIRPGGFQPFQKNTPNQPGMMSLSAMMMGRSPLSMNPIQQKRNGQLLARLLLTGRLPDN